MPTCLWAFALDMRMWLPEDLRIEKTPCRSGTAYCRMLSGFAFHGSTEPDNHKAICDWRQRQDCGYIPRVKGQGEAILKEVVVLALGAVLLCGCVSRQPDVTYEWVRADGRDANTNSALFQQRRIDATICVGEMNKSKAEMPPAYSPNMFEQVGMEINQTRTLDAVVSGCMAEKGYLLVPADQVAATRAEFAKASGKRK